MPRGTAQLELESRSPQGVAVPLILMSRRSLCPSVQTAVWGVLGPSQGRSRCNPLTFSLDIAPDGTVMAAGDHRGSSKVSKVRSALALHTGGWQDSSCGYGLMSARLQCEDRASLLAASSPRLEAACLSPRGAPSTTQQCAPRKPAESLRLQISSSKTGPVPFKGLLH